MTQANFMGGLLQGLSQGLLTFGEIQRQEEKRKKTEKALKSIAELMAEGITPQLGSSQESKAFEVAPFGNISAEGVTEPAGLTEMLANADIMADPQMAALLIGEQLKAQRAQQGSARLNEAIQGGVGAGGFSPMGFTQGPGGVQNVQFGRPEIGRQIVDPATNEIVFLDKQGNEMLRRPAPPDLVQIQTTDAQGNPVTAVVDRTKLGQAGAVRGALPSPQKITPEAAGKIQNVDLGMRAIQTMRAQLLTQDGRLAPGARIALAQMAANIPFSVRRQLKRDALTSIDAIVRARTGAQMNESEKADAYAELVPSALDSDETIVSKLNKLEAFLGGQLDVITLPPRIADLLRGVATGEAGDVILRTPSGGVLRQLD